MQNVRKSKFANVNQMLEKFDLDSNREYAYVADVEGAFGFSLVRQYEPPLDRGFEAEIMMLDYDTNDEGDTTELTLVANPRPKVRDPRRVKRMPLTDLRDDSVHYDHRGNTFFLNGKAVSAKVVLDEYDRNLMFVILSSRGYFRPGP